MPMPESSAVRVTQGKQSIAIDAFTDEGKKILAELVKQADIILHCYRGGVAARMGVDFESVLKLNPTVIYHHGVGYGNDGPYCRRPAFAPDHRGRLRLRRPVGRRRLRGVALTIDEIKTASLQLAGVPSGHPDGFAASRRGSRLESGPLPARSRLRRPDIADIHAVHAWGTSCATP